MQVAYLLAVIKVHYCEYLLKLKDNTIITTLQASSKTIASKAVAQSWIGLKPNKNAYNDCLLFVMNFIQ